MKIDELLASRTDLSTFLVHLTKKTKELSAKDILKKIITDGRLTAGSPFGIAAKALTDKKLNADSQRAVCFTETPMEHLSVLTNDIDGRNYKFEPYGIAITRKQSRLRGVNPIWYIDITPGHEWLMNPLNRLVKKALDDDAFQGSEIASISPYIEQMGVGYKDGKFQYRKEFWWEREWRHVGDFNLPDTYMVLCPVADMAEILALVGAIPEERRPNVSLIDPCWSLERIIGKLAGFAEGDLGPF